MFGQMTFLMRRHDNPMGLVPLARQAVAQVDRTRSLGRISTIDRYLGGRVKERRGYAFLFGLFALASTLLSAVGVYGVVAYSVAERTREIGIRIALGARPLDVLALAGRQALILIAAGLGIGLAGAIWPARLMAPQLWGVTPTDPFTFAAASVLLIGVALVAAYVPARRAMAVEPTVALRSQ
jgi:ABC-type antimicrobial peptide transport system permease subunit